MTKLTPAQIKGLRAIRDKKGNFAFVGERLQRMGLVTDIFSSPRLTAAGEAALQAIDQRMSDMACDRAAAKRHPMFRDRY